MRLIIVPLAGGDHVRLEDLAVKPVGNNWMWWGRALAMLLAAGLLQCVGCKNKEAQPAAATAAAQTSAISVSTESDGIHMHTSAAEFLLRPSGYLQASLQSEGKMLTLEDPEKEAGQLVTAGHAEVGDFVRSRMTVCGALPDQSGGLCSGHVFQPLSGFLRSA